MAKIATAIIWGRADLKIDFNIFIYLY